MKESKEDLSKAVHQLRMLLVDKEEEIEALRNQLGAKGGKALKAEPPSAPTPKAAEVEEYKKTIASLEETIEELKENGEERIKHLRNELAQKNKEVASLKKQLKESPTPLPHADEDKPLNEALEKIAQLEEELSRAQSEAEENTEEERKELPKEETMGLLTEAQNKLEQAESSLRKANLQHHRLSIRNMWLMAASTLLGIWLCISLVVIFNQKRMLRQTAAGMNFITAAEEPVLQVEEKQLQEQPQVPSGAADYQPAGPGVSDETHIAYTVKRGDSLWKICKRELGDPTLADRVAQDNNLKDARALDVGMILYLPKAQAE